MRVSMSVMGAVSILGALAACGDDGASSSSGGGGTETGTTMATGGDATGGAGMGGDATGGTGGMATGGAPPAGCDPYDPASCDGGQVCLVVDESLGTSGGTGCVAPGTKPHFAACAGSGECVAGAFCDRVTLTCKPLCDNSGDCPNEAACTPAQTAAGTEIPGLKLCVAECEPVATTGCDDSEGPVNCTWRDDIGAFDCFTPGMNGDLVVCSDNADCTVGFGCLEVNGQFACMPWCVYDGGTDICTAAEHPDAQFAICLPQIPAISVNGVDYGGCFKQL